MPGKVHGSIIRERAARIRDIGVGLARRFRESQVGTVRPGLTLEDGTLVLTDNYLKVRVKPGRQRNERVTVRLLPVESELSGEIVASTANGELRTADCRPSRPEASSPVAGPAISAEWIP
jgi:hypothetical protein